MTDQIEFDAEVEHRLEAMDVQIWEQAEKNTEEQQAQEYDARVEAEYERLVETVEECIREELEDEQDQQ